MKRIIFTVPGFLLFFILTGCNNLGKEKTYNGVDLYHTANISDTLANSLGDFLVSGKFADGKEKTVQLTKSGNTYHFRMVIKDSLDKDTSLNSTFKLFASTLSARVFNGAPVIVESCDDQMNTLKSFASEDLGKLKVVDGLQLYQTKNITAAEADSLGKYLVTSKFADGTEKTVQIAKSGNTYKFRFVVNKGADKDPEILKSAKAFAAELSANVFKGAPVEVDMCDDNLNTLVALPMDDSTKKM